MSLGEYLERVRQMQVELTIEKTDVKLYKVNVEVDWDDLVNWVDETHGSWETENVDNVEINKFSFEEVGKSIQDYYKYYINDYIESKDPDLLFLDNCHNHQDYQLETEECSVRDANVRSVRYV